jgi:ribosomal protein S27AE
VYSQREEEKYILECFPGKVDGSFLDIGAWSGTTFSNTRRLFELGWSGVLIEPAPGPFIQLMRTCAECGRVPQEMHGERNAQVCPECEGVFYANHPRLRLILAAVGIERGLMRMHATDDALSTSQETQYEIWKKVGKFYGVFHILSLTWSEILNQFGSFDFVNIDTEGTSSYLFLDLMKNSQWRPPVICLEHDSRHVEIQGLAAHLGYRIVYTGGENLVMQHKDLK